MLRTVRTYTCALLALVMLPSCGGAGGSVADSADAVLVTTLSDDGQGSLREAVAALGTSGTIVFDPSLQGVITLSETISLQGEVQIQGAGAGKTILQRDVGFAIFAIQPGADVTISALTLRGPGGAIQVRQGRLRLQRVAVEHVTINSPIENVGGILEMQDCTVRECAPPTRGGALRIDGGITTIRRSTFHDNQSLGDGGAIYHSGGVLLMVNSTLHRNTAQTFGVPSVGGGLRSADTSFNFAEASILHCTVTDNTADVGGGLVFDYVQGGVAIVRASIVAQNVGDAPDIAALHQTSLDGAYNIIGVDGAGAIAHDANGNLVGTMAAPLDPVLGVLLNLGGFTRTRQPILESPALGRVPPGECLDVGGVPLAVDQRGFVRPQSGNCEAGAFER